MIAIIAILAAMLLPALNQARAKGYQISCAGNMKQLGMSAAMYQQANRDIMPAPLSTAGVRWRTLFLPYIEGDSSDFYKDDTAFEYKLQCRTALAEAPAVDRRSYSYVQVDLAQNSTRGFTVNRVKAASATGLYAESRVFPTPDRFGNYISVESTARGVFSRLAAIMACSNPGRRRSSMGINASGVRSRGESPVPPVEISRS